MRMRALIASAVVVIVGACASADRIRIVQDVPAEVTGIVQDVWRDLEERLAWAAECMAPVEVFLSRDVPDGAARYRADEQLIEVQIPTSPARFRESLVHELGHHIDATCSGLEQVRSEFTMAQDLDPGGPWNDGEAWESTPAEHFAEAVVAIVNHERLLHEDRIVLFTSSLEIVERAGS